MKRRYFALGLAASLVTTATLLSSSASASTERGSASWRPIVKVTRAPGQLTPTIRSSVRFKVSFSARVRGFTARDIKLLGRVGSPEIRVVARGGTSYIVTVANIKRPSRVIATVPAAAAEDSLGRPNRPGKSAAVVLRGPTRKPRKPAPPAPAPSPSSPSAPSAPSAGDPLVGVIVNGAGGGSAALDKAAAAGARWVREDLSWRAVEPMKGKRDWALYDALFLRAAERGIRVLPILEQVPAWAGATSNWYMPSDPALFAAFVADVTARYGPGGALWLAHPDLAAFAPVYFEVWNEPWLPFFSSPVVDPARYARLFRAAAAAGKAANSQARFIVSAEWQYHAQNGSWRKWVDDMYAAVPDLNSYADAYSTHPYGNGSIDNWTPGNGDAFQTRRLEIVHDNFVSHGAGDKKMWITEVGWSTCSGGDNCYSEAAQQQNLARFDELARSSWSSFVAATFYYRLVDLNGADRANKELWFGAIRADGSAKPAYDTLRKIINGS